MVKRLRVWRRAPSRASAAAPRRIATSNDDGLAKRVLQDTGVSQVQHESHPLSLFEKYGADVALEAAFDPVAPIEQGGRLVIDETQALTAIDVDTAGLGASSPLRCSVLAS